MNILTELYFKPRLPIPLHSNNESIIALAQNPIYHELTKHVDIDCHFTREKI